MQKDCFFLSLDAGQECDQNDANSEQPRFHSCKRMITGYSAISFAEFKRQIRAILVGQLLMQSDLKRLNGRITVVKTKLLYGLGLILLSVVSGYGQPTNGAVYWSTTQPDCSSLGESSAVPITNSSGATIGYSCYISGTFVWFAAGGIWGTTVRVSAPASAPIGV